MKRLRWLLPFTCGVDMHALDYVVQLAASGGAELVAVSIMTIPQEQQSRGVRLDYIQQSKDFLEAVYWIAARSHVTVEYHEITTTDVIQHIRLLIHDLHCDGIVLVSKRGKESLLRMEELKLLLVEPPAPLVILRLSGEVEESCIHRLQCWFKSWRRSLKCGRDRSVLDVPPPSSESDEPLWIRAEERNRR
jgi:hypothetical protein